MPPTRTRPSAEGITIGLPTSLFYVTSERTEPWRPRRLDRPLVDWSGVIDLRDDTDDDA